MSISLFIVGTIIGSFLNVCIYRLPRGESVVWPASHCPKCGRSLAVWELLPLVSYLFLLGRCRQCHQTITWRYPAVELLTGLWLPFLWLVTMGNWLDFGFLAIFTLSLMVVFFTDLETQLIPDWPIGLATAAGLIYHFFFGYAPAGLWYGGGFFSALLGMLACFLLLGLIGEMGKKYFHKEGMGEGDLYLGLALGAYLGWLGGILAIFLGSLIASAFLLILLLVGKVKLGQYVPFGPALVLGGLLVLFWGNRLVAWYLSWLM